MDLTAGFWWILILVLVGLDSWCVGLWSVHCLVEFCFCFGSWFVGVAPLSFFGGDQLNNLHWLLVWFFLVPFGVFCDFPLSLLCGFVFLAWSAGWPLFWTHLLALCCGRLFCIVSNLPSDTGLLQFLSTQTSVKGGASWWPLWLKVGYQAVEGVCAGMRSSTLSTKVHTTKKTSFYVGTSCGFSLTDQSEIRKVQGYRYLCTLGRGSNLLLHPWFASKA